MKKSIIANNSAKPIGPYSPSVMVNGFLFISGQIALDSDGNLIVSNIKEETKQVMNNIINILKAAHLDINNLVKVSIFIKDMGLFDDINSTYGSFFEGIDVFPARETVEVSNLPKNVNIEISAIAHSRETVEVSNLPKNVNIKISTLAH